MHLGKDIQKYFIFLAVSTKKGIIKTLLEYLILLVLICRFDTCQQTTIKQKFKIENGNSS